MTLNTKQIVELIHNLLLNTNLGKDSQGFNFQAWLDAYRKLEHTVIRPAIPDSSLYNFPFRDEVIKQVFAALFGYMPFSKEYILKNYEHKSSHGIHYLQYPASAAKRMIVFFSGLSTHKTYNRYSWYWDPTEKWDGDTAYLFINDLSDRWYVGNADTPTRPAYRSIILNAMKRFDIKADQVYTVGGSMGGYGALLYSIEMNLGGAICVNPQLNIKSAGRHRSGDWLPKIAACGSNFIDADDLIHLHEKLPPIYLEYCDYEADRDAAHRFLDSVRSRTHFVMIKKVKHFEHVTDSPTKDKVEAVLRLFERSAAFDS
ncbi:hypothetical protein [Cupriavidus necator]